MPLLEGRLCEMAYPLLPPFLIIFYSNQRGAGGRPLCPLSMPVTIVQPEFVNGGHARGAKRPSGGVCVCVCVCVRGGGGVSPSHSMEILENLRMKTALSCTLNSLLGVCSGIDQFPTLFSFFTRRATGGGGGHGPLVPPLATRVPIVLKYQYPLRYSIVQNKSMHRINCWLSIRPPSFFLSLSSLIICMSR